VDARLEEVSEVAGGRVGGVIGEGPRDVRLGVRSVRADRSTPPTPPSRRIKVRVLGIDTPETRDPRTGVQCWDRRQPGLPRTLLGQRVTLVTDPTQDVRDRYDRLLADVRLADGRDYSIEAARAGAARSYVSDRPVVEHAAIVAAEAEAHDARRGLWGACP
jgi:endonuclease YncB( thermonuclease family)